MIIAGVCEPGQLVHVIDNQPMANVVDGVTPIQEWLGLIGGKSFAGAGLVGAGGAAVPGGAIVYRVTKGIRQVEGYVVPRLRLQRGLQSVIVRVGHIQPIPESSVVAIQAAIAVEV